MATPRHSIPPPVLEGLDFADLAARVMRLKDRDNPTTPERDNLWNATCQMLQDNAGVGCDTTQTKRVIIRWLWNYGPRLAETETALTRNLERKFQRFAEIGKVADLRAEANKAKRAPKLCQADRDELVGCAVFKHGGDLDCAWATCTMAGKLSAELLARYPIKPGRRSRCPKSIRRQIAGEVVAVYNQHVGPRSARLNGAYIQRDWNDVYSGDWHSSDDITLPVYYYLPDGNGWFYLTRGQFLPMIDVKSKRVLDFVLIDSKSYTAAAIRGLITHVCQRHGLPRTGWHFERGIWKNSKMVGGGSKCEPWDDVGETFASRLSLRLMHAQPGNARAKVVENVAGRLQDLMEGEPGYVGRNEMSVKFERVQKLMLLVSSKDKDRRVHPAQLGFLSAEQWQTRLVEICQEYNTKPQDSLVMGERLSPDQAWEKNQPRNAIGKIEPISKLPDELQYLLAAHKEVVRVTRNGVSLFSGKFRYLSEVTGAMQGQSVYAWFDPDRPETIAITDLKGENLQTVPRIEDVPAFTATREQLRTAMRGVNAHNGYGRRRYSELKSKFMPPIRRVVADPESVDKGRRMETQRTELIQRQNQTTAAEEREIRQRDSFELYEFERDNWVRLGMDREPTPPPGYNSARTVVSNFLNAEK